MKGAAVTFYNARLKRPRGGLSLRRPYDGVVREPKGNKLGAVDTTGCNRVGIRLGCHQGIGAASVIVMAPLARVYATE